MGRLGYFFAGLITVLVLDALMFGLFVSISGVPADAVFAAGPDERAARAAFARALKGFPAELRRPGDVGDFVLLSRPVAEGGYLCSVRELRIRPKDAGGEEIAMTRLLVVRHRLGGMEGGLRRWNEDCAKQTDLSHPVEGNVPGITRMLIDLRSLQAAARAGALRVAPDCLESRSGGAAKACSTAAVLASLDLDGLRKVRRLDDFPLDPMRGPTEDALLSSGKGACGSPDRVAVRIVKLGPQDKIAAVRVRVIGC